MLASLLFNAYMQVSFFSISTLLRSLFLSLSYSLALAPSLPFLLHHCLLRVRSIEFEKVYIVAFICHSISLFTIRKKNNKCTTLSSTPQPSSICVSLQTSKQHTQSTQPQNHRTQSKTLSSGSSTGCHSRRRRSVIASSSGVINHCTSSTHGRCSGDRGRSISGHGSAGRNRRNRGCGCSGRGSGFRG
jgi:hypothetical protein